ncbi:IclR family transcriptional regulator [Streptomyces sp. NPDC058067]|uniref:IclR family transcriptional regulator n=1 Tax=Streptomyces antnestii TaxID=2494256 RepID=A0A437PCL8_9ACTN|nr:IclR family transcriptional regulator [Streptomyces sp. San01]RVU19989.1 IclR family transcriptional regulator [Streptomyces sp. San01]
MSTVPAAAQVLAILRYLAAQAGPVPAAAISRDVQLPRSTTYHLLDTLAREGFVVHLPEERRYGLGVSAFELGSGYSRQAPFQRLARVPLAKLVDRTGHNAHLAVLHGREVIYVIEERAPGRAPLVTEVGVRLPAHLTASGRAVLARLPQAQVRALFPDASAFVMRNESGPGSPSALRNLLVEVRRRGYSTEDGEVTPGFASVAAAVLDHTAHPIAGVAVTFPAEDVGPEEQQEIAQQVARTAAEVSRRVGGVTDPARVPGHGTPTR